MDFFLFGGMKIGEEEGRIVHQFFILLYYSPMTFCLLELVFLNLTRGMIIYRRKYIC